MPHAIEYVYKGAFCGEAKHAASGTTLRTDVGKEFGGAESSFTPADLLVAALASCTLATMDLVAQRDGVSLAGTSVSAEKSMSDSKPLRIAAVRLNIRLPHVPETLRSKLERVAAKCPVHNSLHPETKIELIFEYTD